MALPLRSAYIVSQTLRPKGICRGRALGHPSRYCSPMTQNLLVHEASPYLLQHKDNPVHWRSWGPEALAEAKRQDKPLLLSIGYSACHWCHVMAHESFEDPAIAALMNELFVNIKVDREERPDLDAIYQLALAFLGASGGWPLTMFLTPAGEPFWGGTYFPKTSRFGRPAFADVLRGVHQTYHHQPERIHQNTAALTDALMRFSRNVPGDGLDPALLDGGAMRLLEEVDMHFGGIGRAPKFPLCNLLELLWRHYRRTGNEDMRNAVAFSVNRMSMGGIYDHLGGGYARYSTDVRWLVPHFEKMLYDNAQLLELLVHLWQEERDPLFKLRAQETVDWLLREMIAENGAFASALDADSEGEEGRFYVWSEREVDSVLGPNAEFFKRVYDVTGDGNWEGQNILHRLGENQLSDDATEANLARLRARLFDVRSRRPYPNWDDSTLADWNGLMITALARASDAFERRDWLAAARRAFDTVVHRMTVKGRLCHSQRNGTIKRVEFLDDYASMARAALALFESTGEAHYCAQAEAWVAVADAHYWDAKDGGYFYTPDDGERLITRTKSARDQATPSGNGSMAEVLARLFYLTGQDAYRVRAEQTFKAFSGDLKAQFPNYATLINAHELLEDAVQIALIGEPGAPMTETLRRAINGVSLPNRVLLMRAPGAALPSGHPARGKEPIDGRATAYVCRGPVCSLPITDAAELTEALRKGAEGARP